MGKGGMGKGGMGKGGMEKGGIGKGGMEEKKHYGIGERNSLSNSLG
jgi:hypothetical protein